MTEGSRMQRLQKFQDMSKRRKRIQSILEILNNNYIGSQEELSRMLAARDFVVTQATLSRDLKAIRATKVATDLGAYRYVVNQPGDLPVDDIFEPIPPTTQSGVHYGVTSVAFSGNLMLFKTRLGYASGLAYDLDQLDCHLILGTISGADTVMAVIDERIPRAELFDYFNGFLPDDVLKEARKKFM